MSKLAPSNNISMGFCTSTVPTTLPFSCFWNLEFKNASLECFEETKLISILLIPSTQVASTIVVSIPAVIPMLYFPTG